MAKIILCLVGLVSAFASYSQAKTDNLVIVTFDGFRWQELFDGADSLLIRSSNFVDDTTALLQKYWASTPSERRQKLLPFIWSTILENGQLYGNRAYGNNVNVKNAYRLSYPGYNEIFSGYPDSLISNNDKKYNENVTVLEWLNRQAEFKGRIAAFTSWDVFKFIFNAERSGFAISAGVDPVEIGSSRLALLNEMQANSFQPFDEGIRPDLLTYYLAKEYLKTEKPKLLFIGFDDTDDWAHNGKYDYYLQSANLCDQYVKDLWNTLQSMPEYKDKTTLILTTDHGRGDYIKKEWTSHGKKIAGADQTWMAFLGKGVSAKGEVNRAQQLYQAQLAQTIADFFGYHFIAAHPTEKKISFGSSN